LSEDHRGEGARGRWAVKKQKKGKETMREARGEGAQQLLPGRALEGLLNNSAVFNCSAHTPP